MELFKTDVFKREYQDFVNTTLPNVLNCNYCNIDCCKWHKRFMAVCNKCREQRCINCSMFNLSVNFLMQNADDVGKNYIHNFVLDFLNISDRNQQMPYHLILRISPYS